MALSKIVMAVELGGNRQLHVLEGNEVIIKDMLTKKCAFFTGARWKRFVGDIDEIDEHVQISSIGKPTLYRKHIGGTWHVSVDDKFPTVDIRRWYEKAGNSLKPTYVGIALTHHNWENLKRAAVKVNDEIPAMTAISPCWHDSQIEQAFCNECTPYHSVDDVTDVEAAAAAEKLVAMVDTSGNGSARRRKTPKPNPLFSAIE